VQPGRSDTLNHGKSLQKALRLWRLLISPRNWWRGGDHQRRTANATVLLALGTLVLAGVNMGMLIEMRLASYDTKKAIDATNRLADAAQINNDLGQRANISLRDIIIYRVPAGAAVIPQWENTGRGFCTKFRCLYMQW